MTAAAHGFDPCPPPTLEEQPISLCLAGEKSMLEHALRLALHGVHVFPTNQRTPLLALKMLVARAALQRATSPASTPVRLTE